MVKAPRGGSRKLSGPSGPVAWADARRDPQPRCKLGQRTGRVLTMGSARIKLTEGNTARDLRASPSELLISSSELMNQQMEIGKGTIEGIGLGFKYYLGQDSATAAARPNSYHLPIRNQMISQA